MGEHVPSQIVKLFLVLFILGCDYCGTSLDDFGRQQIGRRPFRSSLRRRFVPTVAVSG